MNTGLSASERRTTRPIPTSTMLNRNGSRQPQAANCSGVVHAVTASTRIRHSCWLRNTGVGILARPVGGVLWGHFGDRVGRKAMLVASLLLMGAATVAVGLLPTYEQIGVSRRSCLW